ncbi:alpha/beta hydrolase [Deinococcus roseus]|uniref:Peptidase S33 tripeptidyl aminopeptidase-like C-terminal domain-containing protein n=1 Tax=Deinococcus roseus TaxID=392414 RepID=A0ABQ2DJQ6_9DEIO|nr:alpha/beta hydrolase [Deinococcus roseus]GGJ59893.1 hypothetical protein GCM10008938_52520 [Deinococcus roseus]
MGQPLEACDTTPFLGEQLDFPAVPAGFALPLRTEVPILLVSGTLDPATPLDGAWHVKVELGYAMHLVIDGGGHGSYPSLPAYRCYFQVLDGFLRSGVGAELSCTDHLQPFQFRLP